MVENDYPCGAQAWTREKASEMGLKDTSRQNSVHP